MQIISKRAYQDTREGGAKHSFVEFTKDGDPGEVHVLHTTERDGGDVVPKLMTQEAVSNWITKSSGEGWLVPDDELGEPPAGEVSDPLIDTDSNDGSTESEDVSEPLESDGGDASAEETSDEETSEEASEEDDDVDPTSETTFTEAPAPADEDVKSVFTDRGGTEWGHKDGAAFSRKDSTEWEEASPDNVPSIVAEAIVAAGS